MTGAKTATRPKKEIRTTPVSALRLVMSERPSVPRTPARDETRGASSGAWSVRMRIAIRPLSRLPRSRVEPRGDEVSGENRDEHGNGDQQEQGLHEREVLAVDGLEEHEAQPRIVEDDLHEDRAAADETQ